MTTAEEEWQDFIDIQLSALWEQDECAGTFAGDATRAVLRSVQRMLDKQGIVVRWYGEDLGARSTWCWVPAHERQGDCVPSCTTCCAHPDHKEEW